MTKQIKIWLIVGATLTFLSPVTGLLGTIGGMIHAFQTLGSNGIGDPSQLSKSIGLVLVASAAGFGLSIIGIIILCITGCIACFSKPPLPEDR